ncbi:collagenase [Shewanella sp. VB17]|uniref:M9 family metallopeptidase n=1 Tax=Shewanella sp. VB17 TaxID=2739432 RepID=UPI001567140C|nr:M9 family metallopeptidase [Shewanella sp. VB17]NRD72418.1 collagenase [Shewanella sp. VB17]
MKLKYLVVALSLAASFNSISQPSIKHPTHLSLTETGLSAALPLTQTLSPWVNDKTANAMPGLTGPTGSAAVNHCSDFIGLSGPALVNQLVKSDPQCVSPLYALKGINATALFSEANIFTVASEIGFRAQHYTGVDTSGVESLIYFLRAALYVQFYSPQYIQPYTSAVKANIKISLTNIFNNSHIWEVTDENAGLLKESLILIDSAGLGADFNHITKRVLSEYDASWQANPNMNHAANAVFTTLFRGQWDDEMQALFATDHSILDSLNHFQLRNRHLIGTDAKYVLVNSVREMARLYYIPEMKIRTTALVKTVLNSSNKNDESNEIWLAAAEMADYYDRSNCNDYLICGYKTQLETDTLGFNWQCSDTLKMRAQALYQDQAKWACDVLREQERFFHSKLATHNIPVNNDNNEALELIIFDSSNNYQSYAGTFFGIDTNNGGMYLEGSPAAIKNQARFIAYEAQWRQPDFHIWNLQHEYVHYLDGRYNLHGNFDHGLSENTIWWIEGLAEYISYRNGYTAAITMGETAEFPLSTIFKNQYDSGQDRIYRWGYLAVRFMFENHQSDVDQILSYLRNDQYKEYQILMDSIGTRYDNEWNGWLTSGLSVIDNGIVDTGPSDIDALPSGTVSNWTGPKITNSTDYSPCEVTDEAYRYNDQTSLEFDTPIECIYSQNGSTHFAIANVNKTSEDIWVKVGGGWGDADIYYSTTGWASGESNDGYGIGNGNHEVIKVTMDPNENWHYFTLSGDFGGVDLLVSTIEVIADPDPAQEADNGKEPPSTPIDHCGAATITQGQLTLGKSECISGGENNLFVYIEEDNTQLSITTSGGEGDANVYFNADTWATSTQYQSSSTNTGNSEALHVTVDSGWRYITLDTETEFNGVTVTVDLNTNTSRIKDACQTLTPVNKVILTSGEAVCSTDGINYYSLWIDEGVNELTVSSAYGSGDISLYGGTTWPNANRYDLASTTPDSTSENFNIRNPASGWYYITLLSEIPSSGVALQVDLK